MNGGFWFGKNVSLLLLVLVCYSHLGGVSPLNNEGVATGWSKGQPANTKHAFNDMTKSEEADMLKAKEEFHTTKQGLKIQHLISEMGNQIPIESIKSVSPQLQSSSEESMSESWSDEGSSEEEVSNETKKKIAEGLLTTTTRPIDNSSTSTTSTSTSTTTYVRMTNKPRRRKKPRNLVKLQKPTEVPKLNEVVTQQPVTPSSTGEIGGSNENEPQTDGGNEEEEPTTSNEAVERDYEEATPVPETKVQQQPETQDIDTSQRKEESVQNSATPPPRVLSNKSPSPVEGSRPGKKYSARKRSHRKGRHGPTHKRKKKRRKHYSKSRSKGRSKHSRKDFQPFSPGSETAIDVKETTNVIAKIPPGTIAVSNGPWSSLDKLSKREGGGGTWRRDGSFTRNSNIMKENQELAEHQAIKQIDKLKKNYNAGSNSGLLSN